MDYVYALLALFSGLGAFLIGFKLLSDNIEKLANSGIKKIFNKTSKNRFIGIGIGAIVTAIIQSSSATTVMIVGFVNAGVMDLFQATAMIMGANIGTTITAQIVALQVFDISQFAMVFSCIGIFIYMFSKKDKTRTTGLALAGLGLVFLALKFMSNSMNIFKQSDAIINILSKCNNPFLLLLIGIGFTALIQSSSATTTILISMVSAGISIGNNSNAILFVVLGSNIGTCITALLSSIGTTTNAKRASIIHLLFNVFGTLLFFILLISWRGFMDNTFCRWFKYPATQIAMFHTFFNVIVTLIFVPFINLFVKLACLIIKDKHSNKKEDIGLDERFLKTPAIALSQVYKSIIEMGGLCMNTLDIAIDTFKKKDIDAEPKVREQLVRIDDMNRFILDYLIKISSQNVDDEDEKLISKLHHTVNDFYREAEIADNMLKYTRETLNNNLEFSLNVNEKISRIKELLDKQFDDVKKLMEEKNYLLISDIDETEESIDQLRSKMIEEHIKRLEKGECSPNNSGVYINLVSNLERAGDHLNYIAHTIIEG